MRKLVEPLVNEGAIVLSRRGPDPAPNHLHVADYPPPPWQHTVVILLSRRAPDPAQNHPHVQQFLEAGGGKSRNIHESLKVGDGKS